MSTSIFCQFRGGGSNAGGVWQYNDFDNLITVQTLDDDLQDSTSALTGVSLDITTAFAGGSASASQATSGAGTWPELVLESYIYASNATPGVLQFGGLTQGDTFELKVAGHAADGARNTNFTVSPANEGQTLYDNAGTGAPLAPITFTGTIGAAGTIDVTVAGVTSFGYINGIELIITAGSSGPSITDVNTTESWNDGDTGLVITGTGFI